MDEPLLLSAMLESKDDHDATFFPETDLYYLDIEVEVIEEDTIMKRSYYSVSVFVTDNRVAKSAKSNPQSSVVKWEWKDNNQM